MEGMLHEGLLPFVALTLVIGGGMAWAAGGAVADGWKSMAHLVFYVFLLTLADRFLHFALFEGTLLSVRQFLIDFLILLAFGYVGVPAAAPLPDATPVRVPRPRRIGRTPEPGA